MERDGAGRHPYELVRATRPRPRLVVPAPDVPEKIAETQKANILLVDDHPENLLVLETTLESLGQNLVRANSGHEALKHVLKEDFAVILLDVQMPEMDGFETAVLIRERERSKTTPIIFVTAVSTSEEFVFKGYALGAVDYILKPIAPEILRSKVAVFVELWLKTQKLIEQEERLRRSEKRESDRKYVDMQKLMRTQADERIASIVDIAADAVITIDNDRRVRLFNKSAEALFRVQNRNIVGEIIDQVLPSVWPADGDWMTGERREIAARRADGTMFPAEASFSILRHEDSLHTMILRDITDRKLAIEELKSYSKKLSESNRELRDLVMAASHDLQEPLRRIQIFSDRLVAKARDQIPENIRIDIEKMNRSAHQMHLLINDLLAFSRVTAGEGAHAPVDLNATLKLALGDFEERIEETHTAIEAGFLPTVTANSLQMRQLFNNLIGNALKFRSKNRPLQITISSRRIDEGACEITVADNGIGFDEKYLGKIFTIFERLHARDEYEGTGIGLAICRKIVERHGGTITAQSAPDSGAKFIITLPC